MADTRPSAKHQSERPRLPWTYWPIMLVGCLFAGVVGATVAMAVGVNPYIGFSLGWGFLALREVYILKRKGL